MTYAQNDAQARLMVNGYDSLQAAGVITTPSEQSLSAVVGQVYTGTDRALTSARATLTDSVNGQVASLVTNASKYGTELTSQWAKGLPSVSGLSTNVTNIQGLRAGLTSIPGVPSLGSLTSGITPTLPSVKTAMDTLAKGSQFAATASSTLTSRLDKIPNISVSGLTSQLPSVSSLSTQLGGQATRLAGQAQAQAGALVGQAQAQAGALVGQAQAQATALVGQAQAQAGALVGQLQGQATALIDQARGRIDALLGQGDKLVASVQKAAGFSNTVNRATVDVATTKIFGSDKIPTPNFGPKLSDSASIGAALDIKQAQGFLKDIQTQGTGLVNQARGQLAALSTAAQNQVNSAATAAGGAVNRFIG
jgi:cell division septum initiation protein DivIVA